MKIALMHEKYTNNVWAVNPEDTASKIAHSIINGNYGKTMDPSLYEFMYVEFTPTHTMAQPTMVPLKTSKKTAKSVKASTMELRGAVSAKRKSAPTPVPQRVINGRRLVTEQNWRLIMQSIHDWRHDGLTYAAIAARVQAVYGLTLSISTTRHITLYSGHYKKYAPKLA